MLQPTWWNEIVFHTSLNSIVTWNISNYLNWEEKNKTFFIQENWLKLHKSDIISRSWIVLFELPLDIKTEEEMNNFISENKLFYNDIYKNKWFFEYNWGYYLIVSQEKEIKFSYKYRTLREKTRKEIEKIVYKPIKTWKND